VLEGGRKGKAQKPGAASLVNLQTQKNVGLAGNTLRLAEEIEKWRNMWGRLAEGKGTTIKPIGLVGLNKELGCDGVDGPGMRRKWVRRRRWGNWEGEVLKEGIGGEK